MKRIIGILILIAAIAGGVFYFLFRDRTIVVVQPPCVVPATTDRTYIIADMVYSAELRTDREAKLIALNRTNYALFHRESTQAPSPFSEWYEVSKFVGATPPAGRDIRSGNWDEGVLTGSRVYDVKYAYVPNGITLVSTGADYVLPMPIPARGNYKHPLKENEDFWSYANSDRDTICRNSFVVSSRDVTLSVTRVFEADPDGTEVDGGVPKVVLTDRTPEGIPESTIRVIWPTPLLPGRTRQVNYQIDPKAPALPTPVAP